MNTKSPAPSFNSWRIPASPAAHALVAEVVPQLLAFESDRGLRKRKRSIEGRRILDMIAAAILADVSYRFLQNREQVVVPRGDQAHRTKSCYRPDIFGREFVHVLDLLRGVEADGRVSPMHAFIHQVTGYRKVRALETFGNRRPPKHVPTRINAAADLQALIRKHHLTLADFGQRPGRTVVVMKGDKLSNRAGSYFEYPESLKPEIDRRAEEVRKINDHIARGHYALSATYKAERDYRLDPRDTHLCRYFTRKSIKSGGRLFGSFWLDMSKAEKLRMKVDGEPVVILDFAQMLVNLAYAHARVPVPAGDAYDFGGLPRPLAKKLFASCLFSKWTLTRWPKRLTREAEGYSFTAALRALKEKHPALASLWFTAVGHELQFIESNIIVSVMLQLIAYGVHGLPVHDALVVPRSAEALTAVLMRRTFCLHAGATCEVVPEKHEPPAARAA